MAETSETIKSSKDLKAEAYDLMAQRDFHADRANYFNEAFAAKNGEIAEALTREAETNVQTQS